MRSCGRRLVCLAIIACGLASSLSNRASGIGDSDEGSFPLAGGCLVIAPPPRSWTFPIQIPAPRLMPPQETPKEVAAELRLLDECFNIDAGVSGINRRTGAPDGLSLVDSLWIAIDPAQFPIEREKTARPLVSVLDQILDPRILAEDFQFHVDARLIGSRLPDDSRESIFSEVMLTTIAPICGHLWILCEPFAGEESGNLAMMSPRIRHWTHETRWRVVHFWTDQATDRSLVNLTKTRASHER